jgi:two-component system sensor histidine kinase YesM
VALANKNAIGGLLPLLVGMLVSTLAIIALSNWFLKRINSFSTVMHAAAVGDFEVENTEIGQVHDEIWDLNNDLNQMIQDIKALMEAAAEERVQKEQIYSRQKEVEFKMLATQINPHFLYNTLENIRMLARINKQPEIEDISVTLTRLLRRSLSANHEQVTLLWEMETAEYYIRIQNYRFGDRIRAELTYDKEQAANYLILPFVVQPFVENAYVHAMEDKEADGLITVRAEITDRLVLTVEDNGQGMDQETLAEITRYINDFENLDRTHIGICNVNQRIKLKFGDEYGVDFESEKGVGTKVQITIPLVTSDGNIQ